ncbi:MAG TPA: M20/M25/M40 family metallo-hydrolase [Thermoanaerobaculia bacterium]|nr:M20/M25/M40 family metallo-hydrolase [Thermoanaerobaculia bacterium]
MHDPIILARELIDIPSVTGEERAVAEFVETWLTAAGFTCQRQFVSNDRFNLLARGSDRPRVVLCTHLDTVPPFLQAREDDEFLHGRGACDTKGILAAMMVAAGVLLLEGSKDLALLLVVGEETDSIGAREANRDLGSIGSEVIIVGEPTGLRYVAASKGALTAAVRFQGRAAHSAHPELGDSAVLKMARAIAAIDAHDWGTDPLLGRATANIGLVRGGEKPNIVPASAEMEMIFRIVDDPATVRNELELIVAKEGGEIVRSHGNPPVLMHVPEGEEGIVVGFNTDVPYLDRFGRAVLIGPGSILDAHGLNEKIAKRDVATASVLYHDLVAGLLRGSVTLRPSRQAVEADRPGV